MKYLDRKDVLIKQKQIHQSQEHFGRGFMDLRPSNGLEQLVNNPIGVPDMSILKGTRRKPQPVEIANFNRTFDSDDLGNLKVGDGYKKSIKFDKKFVAGFGIRQTKKKYNNLKFEL